MFNNTAVFMGDWKAVKNEPPSSDGKWHLFNITADIGENIDLAMSILKYFRSCLQTTIITQKMLEL